MIGVYLYRPLFSPSLPWQDLRSHTPPHRSPQAPLYLTTTAQNVESLLHKMLSAAILQIHSQILFLQPLGGGGHPPKAGGGLSLCVSSREGHVSFHVSSFLCCRQSRCAGIWSQRSLNWERERERERIAFYWNSFRESDQLLCPNLRLPHIKFHFKSNSNIKFTTSNSISVRWRPAYS